MCFNDCLGDAEPYAYAPEAPRGGTVCLVEAIEDEFLVPWRDTDTLILHGHVQCSPAGPYSDVDQASIWTELDRIVELLG